MATQAMGNTQTTVAAEVNILKRAGFEAIPVTLDATAFTNNVCKAGAPIGSDGTIKNDANCKGILLHDVYDDRPQGSILKKAYVNDATITAHYGTAIASAARSALPMIVFE